MASINAITGDLGLETSTEIAGCGGVRDQVRTQGIHVGRVVPQALDVLQARAAAQYVVSQVEHVVGFVIRQMHFQQLQPLVEFFRQAQLRDQTMDSRDASETHRIRVRTDLVVDHAGCEHRSLLRCPVSGLLVTGSHSPSTASDVSAASVPLNPLHRKGLLRWRIGFPLDYFFSNNGRPFRSIVQVQSQQSRLFTD
jgi:hypothetical protein